MFHEYANYPGRGGEQFFVLLREGRRQGCHVVLFQVTRECGSADPQPIEPEDAAAALKRQMLSLGSEMKRLFARLEQMEAGARPVSSIRKAG